MNLFFPRSLSTSGSMEEKNGKEARKGNIRRERAKKLKGIPSQHYDGEGGVHPQPVHHRTPDLVYHYCNQCMLE